MRLGADVLQQVGDFGVDGVGGFVVRGQFEFALTGDDRNIPRMGCSSA